MMSAIFEDEDLVLRPTTAYVDLVALRANVAAIRARVGARRIMGIVKANAYGHGLVRVAQALLQDGVDELGVAFLEEGIALRRAGVTAPILVLGGIIGNQIRHFLEHDLMITASSAFKLRQIEEVAATLGEAGQGPPQGRHRDGAHRHPLGQRGQLVRGGGASRALRPRGRVLALRPGRRRGSELHAAAARALRGGLRVLSATRPADAGAAHGQLRRDPAAPRQLLRHGAAGDHALRRVPGPRRATEPAPDSGAEPADPGGVLQGGAGWAPGQLRLHLGARAHDTRVVTLPVGYGDGYSRMLSGKAEVLIHGTRYPVVGRITMDATMVDIGQDSAHNADPVVLLGAQHGLQITVEEDRRLVGHHPLRGAHDDQHAGTAGLHRLAPTP
ncbi:MAG: alanine racemase [Deltaproteobacteria bacterium]|nr:alanine racemase [Deltaproteobacteria bacterium]